MNKITSEQTASATELRDRANPHHVEIRRRARGKIANLPKAVRNRINQMLYDGVPYAQIIAAVADAAPGLNEDNLSRWYNSHYVCFQEHAERLEEERDKLERVREYLTRNTSVTFEKASHQLLSAQLWEVIANFDPAQLGNYLTQNPQYYLRLAGVLLKLSQINHPVSLFSPPEEEKVEQPSPQPNHPGAPTAPPSPQPTPSVPPAPSVPSSDPAQSPANRAQSRSIADILAKFCCSGLDPLEAEAARFRLNLAAMKAQASKDSSLGKPAPSSKAEAAAPPVESA